MLKPSKFALHLRHILLHIHLRNFLKMMPCHILAMLSHKHLKVGHPLRFKTILRFFLPCEKGREVLLHLGEMIHEIDADLFEVVELLQEVPLRDQLGGLCTLVQVSVLIVLKMPVEQLRQFLYYLAICV